jgi:amidohydrolase
MIVKTEFKKWLDRANALQAQISNWRRDFHMHPEIGLQEVRTAGIVATELERLGYHVQTGVAKTGVVAWLPEKEPGPVVLLRFDMDALPLQEENDVPYRSKNDGVMHACGHDGHTAAGLGIATLLAKHREELPGAVKLVFQPGEEGYNGAEIMVKEGLLDKIGPVPDYALASHLWNALPVGKIGLASGPVMAASEMWKCDIRGRGGHGASPHLAVDPTIVAAQLILGWQTIVSREIDPMGTAVISVGSMLAGKAPNIIPETVQLTGTIRTFDPDERKKVLRRMEEITMGVSAAFNCEAKLELMPLTPAVINDPVVTNSVRQIVLQALGEDNIKECRTMGSEDMAFINAEIPGCYVFVGSQNNEAGLNASHHNPRFDFDESALPLAAALLITSAITLMNS